MKALKRRVAQGVFLILLLGRLTSVAFAQGEAVPWFNHEYGSAEVEVHAVGDGEEKLLLDGFLRFSYPHQFQVAYGTTNGVVIISSFADFIELQTKDEHQYGYDKHWLVANFEQYFFSLLEFSKRPLEYSGSTQIADRDVFRYVDQEDPTITLWLDQETNIPLLIRKGKDTLLTVEAYSLQTTSGEVELELSLLYPEHPAKINLILNSDGWVPTQIEIKSPTDVMKIRFTKWNFEYDWVADSQLAKLGKLRKLNERFLGEFEKERWADALITCQEMSALFPHYWQVYLYQAFAYEGLGNFLGVVENYQQVIMREPRNALALNNLAYHYFLKEVQIAQALELAERAVELERKPAYLDTLGYGYYLVGRFEEALELLEEALAGAEEPALEEIERHVDLVLKALGRIAN